MINLIKSHRGSFVLSCCGSLMVIIGFFLPWAWRLLGFSPQPVFLLSILTGPATGSPNLTLFIHLFPFLMAFVALIINILKLSTKSGVLIQAILLAAVVLGTVTMNLDLPSLSDSNVGTPGVGEVFLILGYFCILAGTCYDVLYNLPKIDQ